jgi:3-methyladenine DNA glycosylase AlkC
MAEPLKNSFGPAIPRRIAGMISAVHPSFDGSGFVDDVLDGYEPLELKQRGLKIARSMRAFLPDNYEAAVEILLASLGPTLDKSGDSGMGVFLYFPHVFFVHEFGLNYFEASMAAQYELTQRFTAEFSIRPFLEHRTEETLDRLRLWTGDSSQHVRRLVSEGTRPRLPWASRLRIFQRDPAPVIELLELLKDDPELYVRRSVANNLNDIGKDHPELLVRVADRWTKNASKERQWIVRHGLRTAVKRGDVGALAILGYGDDSGLTVTFPTFSPAAAKIGDHIIIGFTLTNTGPAAKAALVDFRIHYIKKNGTARPKVFKFKEVVLQPGESVQLRKKVSLKEMTTRKHFPGSHAVDALVNGTVKPLGQFALQRPE